MLHLEKTIQRILLENTPRAGAYARARNEGREGQKTKGERGRTQGTRHASRGVGRSSRGALGMHVKCTGESLLKNY